MIFMFVLGRVEFTDFASHAKIREFANTHFIDQQILQFDVSVDIAHYIMEVLKTSHDLPEHHPNVIMWEGRVTVALKNVKHRTSRTELGDEVIGIRGVMGFEKGEDMFVMK